MVNFTALVLCFKSSGAAFYNFFFLFACDCAFTYSAIRFIMSVNPELAMVSVSLLPCNINMFAFQMEEKCEKSRAQLGTRDNRLQRTPATRETNGTRL